jgi:hypothetical protein
MLLRELEPSIATNEIKQSLVLTMERLDMDFKHLNSATCDIIANFGFMPLNHIENALKHGSFGEYGMTFRLNTQTVCFWLKEYNKSKKSKLGL